MNFFSKMLLITALLSSTCGLASQAYPYIREAFTDGYPSGQVASDVRGDALQWQHGLEKRAWKDWAPSIPLSKEVQITGKLTDVGRIYEFEFVKSSGNGQSDADCLQAVLGAATYNPHTEGVVFGGRLSFWNFEFDQATLHQYTNSAVSDYFKLHPSSRAKNAVAVFTIPLDVLERYPGLFTKEELISASNLYILESACRDESRPPDKCGALRPLSMYCIINHYAEWQRFFGDTPHANKNDILKFKETLGRS